MDEAQLITHILQAAGDAGAQVDASSEGVRQGPGDDCAVFAPPPGFELVWTTDDQLEGVHFERGWSGLQRIGAKAAGASLSDLAAMGARPLGALLSLGLPGASDLDDARSIARGLGGKLAACGCPLLGGNVTRHPDRLSICVTALGAVAPGRALLRSSGRAGDHLFVSGPLGWSRLGLLWLTRGGAADAEGWSRALDSLLDPRPRLEVGAAVVEHGLRAACLDLSDGLARDLPRLARASGLRAVVDSARLPGPSPELAAELGLDPLELAWLGGEDYELLLAGGDELAAIEGLIEIGRLVAGEPGSVELTGPLAGRELEGFDHLAS